MGASGKVPDDQSGKKHFNIVASIQSLVPSEDYINRTTPPSGLD